MSTAGNFITADIWYNPTCNSQGAPLTLTVAFFIYGWKKCRFEMAHGILNTSTQSQQPRNVDGQA
jgi:hypothetical protein